MLLLMVMMVGIILIMKIYKLIYKINKWEYKKGLHFKPLIVSTNEFFILEDGVEGNKYVEPAFDDAMLLSWKETESLC